MYAFIVGKQLYYANKMSQIQSFGKDDWHIVRRLLIINSFIDAICLVLIYWMYRKSLHHLIGKIVDEINNAKNLKKS